MNRILTILAAASLLGACAATPKALVLKGDARLIGGNEAVAKLEIPGEWFVASKKADRIEVGVPDNFSRLSMSIAPALVGPEACGELAVRAATEVAAAAAAGRSDVKAEVAAVGAPEVVQFTEIVPASPPGPSDRFVVGRIVCKAGALVTVQCSTGIARKETTGALCQKALESLTVDSVGAVVAPVTPMTGAAPAAAAAPAVSKAASLERPNTPNLNERRWENVLAMADKDLGAARDQWKFEYAGDGRYVFSTAAKSVEYLLYCSYGNCVWSSDLVGRALFDLGCAEIKVSVLGEATRGVEGCGKKASYTFNPFNKAWEGGK